MKIRAIAALLFILISVSAFGEGRIKITGYVRDAERRMERLRPIILHCRNWLTDKIKIGAEIFILSNLGGVLIHFLPVSYTHLDVYKRQTYTIIN